MHTQRKYLGKWELGCIVFNSCIYKIFTTYPQNFGKISGSAGWLTALYTGILFLVILFLVLTILLRREKPYSLGSSSAAHTAANGIRLLFFLAALGSAIYALRECTTVLQTVSYAHSPLWFLMFFFILAAVFTAVCGARAVYRMHSLLILPIGIVTLAIAALGLKYADPLYLAPILGTGPSQVFIRGLSTLFLYSDIIFIFLLFPHCRPEVNIRKTVMTGASAAVFVNVFLITAAAMAEPFEMGGSFGVPVYPLAKTAYFGSFWSRLDAAYLTVLILSSILYLALTLHLAALCAHGIRLHKKKKRARTFPKTLSIFLIFFMIFSLSGCYDGREVEAGAYLIALGIDKGEASAYRYTFQLSNPLNMGAITDTSGMGGENEGEDQEKTSSKETSEINKTVNNIIIEDDDFYLALNQLKSHLSKEPELSHLKVIAFSTALAEEGLTDITSVLLKEREIRPSTNLCLADSAEALLTQVKPTLEQSTARYYELLFQNQNTPYAPVTELREFAACAVDSGKDPVLPIADKEKLMGMGIFQNGRLVSRADAQEAMLYKLLSGTAHHISIQAGNSLFAVTSQEKSKIEIQLKGSTAQIQIHPTLKADLIHGTLEDAPLLAAKLEEEMTSFVQKTSRLPADIIGVGKKARLQFLTETDWKNINWYTIFSNSTIFTKSNIKIG